MLNWLLRQLRRLLAWLVVQLAKLALAATLWLVKHAVRQTVRHPRTSVGLAVPSAGLVLLGWEVLTVIFVGLVLVGLVWRQAHRATFEHLVGAFLRTWWRRWWTYRRVWSKVMPRCGLSVEVAGKVEIPKFRKVATSTYWDTVMLDMSVGQELADFEDARGRLAPAFKVERLVLDKVGPRKLRMSLMRKDPFTTMLVDPAPIPESTADIDWGAVVVGQTETFEPLTMSVVGGHTCGSGSTGAGKAAIEWNVLRQLAPAIADGTVCPVFIDPKHMELRRGRALLHSPQDYAATEDATINLLDRLVTEMTAAQEAAGDAGEHDFQPSQARPLRPIFVDELAALLKYWSRGGRAKIEQALGLILTQGRTTGHIVVGVIQEPTKDVFPLRDLFTRRFALRLPTEAHTEAALVDEAIERGATCHLIPEATPGVCFTVRDGQRFATRGRLGYVESQHIAELVAFVQARRAAAATDFDAKRPALVDAQLAAERPVSSFEGR